MRRAALSPVVLATVLAAISAAHAGEIKLRHDGLTLNATLEQTGESWTGGPVVLITHGTLAHNGMEIVTTLQGLFLERDISSLAINLSFGLDDRHGMYECNTPHSHKHTDAVGEIGAWLGWLNSQGVEQVVLLGHSRGGNQTAWFAAERDDPLVAKVILVAPSTWSAEYAAADYEKRYGKALAPVLAQAEQMVERGKGAATLEGVDFIYCPDTTATADAFVSYYAPDPRLDTPHILRNIKKPVLVFVGSEDRVITGLEGALAPLAEAGVVEMEVMDGADHFFRDLYAEDVADRAAEFINAQ